MRVHELKCWPEQFAALLDGSKTFEYRLNDRAYMVGDVLDIGHWDPCLIGGRGYWRDIDGREAETLSDAHRLRFRVTHIEHGGRFGIPEHYCVMALAPVEEKRDA